MSKGISEEIREKIRKDYSKGFISIAELNKKYNVSVPTISKIIKEGGVNPKTFRASAYKSNRESILLIESNKSDSETAITINVQRRKDLKVGLIYDRHNLPVNKYIFESVEKSNMFNYSFYDDTVEEFIKLNALSEQEFSKKNLIVYVTGLTPATASVIKICGKYEINLTLMHYNKDSDGYEAQVIYSEFGNGKMNPIANIFPGATDQIILHENSFGVINSKNEENLFVVKYFRKDSTSKTDNGITYDVFTSKLSAQKFIMFMAQKIFNEESDELVTILFEGGIIGNRNNKYIKKNMFMRFHNFEAF